MNRLKLNPEKMEVMLVRKVEILKDIVLPTFDGVQLTTADSVKSHRVILDPALFTGEQINTAAKRAFCQFSLAHDSAT